MEVQVHNTDIDDYLRPLELAPLQSVPHLKSWLLWRSELGSYQCVIWRHAVQVLCDSHRKGHRSKFISILWN